MSVNKAIMNNFSLSSLRNRFLVLLRFVIAFVGGYIISYLLSECLTDWFVHYLNKAEAIYLGGFIAIIFYVLFILACFCIQSLKKITLVSSIFFCLFYVTSRVLN